MKNKERCFCHRPSEIKLKPCGNGDYDIRAGFADNAIVVFQRGMALGYFDIKYCPICGKEIKESTNDDFIDYRIDMILKNK